jgi:DNA-binding transcriptional ArsR family regulator
MVEQTDDRLDAIFHALGDATRRQMLGALMAGEQSVTQLAAPFAMSLAAASKHIRVLEGAGLIRREVHGRSHLCRLDPGPLARAHRCLAAYERFWSGGLETLERLLSEDDAPDRSRPRRQTPDGDEP